MNFKALDFYTDTTVAGFINVVYFFLFTICSPADRD